jgi:small conductance mechanosensitive channel
MLTFIDFFSSALIKTLLYAGVTLLGAVLADSILRSLIKVPKNIDNRRARNIIAMTRNVITITVFAIAAYIILSLLGINLTPLLASASIIGIVLGIGARSIIEDFLTGLFLLSQNSIALGDYVKIGETEGIVEYIGARVLKVIDEHGAVHIIPNSQIKEIINFSRQKSNCIIDIPTKTTNDISKVIKAAEVSLKQLLENETYAEILLKGSVVNGIEAFIHPEIMIIRVTIVTHYTKRFEIERAYRLLLKKAFENQSISFA